MKCIGDSCVFNSKGVLVEGNVRLNGEHFLSE